MSGEKSGKIYLENQNRNSRRNLMKNMMKKSTKKRTYKRKNIVGNFKGAEDIFWTKVVNGVEKFFESPFK